MVPKTWDARPTSTSGNTITLESKGAMKQRQYRTSTPNLIDTITLARRWQLDGTGKMPGVQPKS